MLAIAYWNLGKRAQVTHVVDMINDLVASHKMSGVNGEAIIGLTETGALNRAHLEMALGSAYRVTESPLKTFLCVENLKSGQIVPAFEEEFSWPFTLRRTIGSSLETHYLWFVHRPSPFGMFRPDTFSVLNAAALRQRIEVREAQYKSDRTIVIGDFNTDPYSDAMIAVEALNAGMCRNLVARLKSRRKGKGAFFTKIPMFYNPMWTCLGDQTSTSQPGSFYNDGDITDSAMWHALDQLLVRPSLIAKLQPGMPTFLTSVGSTSLLSKTTGKIDKSISDHLPIAAAFSI